MGYRSEVAYTIIFRDKKTINEFIALVMVNGGHKTEALRECSIDMRHSDPVEERYCVNFHKADVKWYEMFKHIRVIASMEAHEWLRVFAVQRFPDDCAWTFVRVGEEVADIEHERDGAEDLLSEISYDIYTRTEIATEFDTNYESIGDKLALIP